MPPQDPQIPPNSAVTPPPPGGVDLSAQIPPSYAPSMAPAIPPAAPAASSALQDALYEQLKVPQQPAPAAPAPAAPVPPVMPPPAQPVVTSVNPGSTPLPASEEPLIPPLAVASSGAVPDPLDAHLQSDEPDPMIGFIDPALRQATPAESDIPLVGSQPVGMPTVGSPITPVAPAAELPSLAAATAPLPSVPPSPQADPTSLAQPAPAVSPAPAAAQAYDPSLEVATGSIPSSSPVAPAPLPMPTNPLELDGSPVLQPAVPEPDPIAPTIPEPAPAEVGPDPIAAPSSLDYTSAAAVDPGAPPRIDLVTGLPIDQLPQMQPTDNPPLQSMLDDSSQAALDPLDPYADPMLMSEGSMSSSESSGKSILFSVGIGAAVLVFGIIVLALVLGKKPVTELSVDTLSNNQTKTIEATITVPDGYVAIAKQCYEFGLPVDNTVSTTDTSCRIDASFGEQGVSNVAIVPFIEKYENLDEAVKAAKKTTGVTASNQTAERDIVLGGNDAKEIVYNAGTQAAPLSKTLIVVLPEDGAYKQGDDVITSFGISMSSNDSYSQAAVATLEATWTWRK